MQALWWFDRCYAQDAATGAFHLIALPSDGGVGVQPAWLWDALQVLQRTYDAIVGERRAQRHKVPPRRRAPEPEVAPTATPVEGEDD